MADTYTYAGSYRANMIMTTRTATGGAVETTAYLDSFSVSHDTPVESITRIGSSLGDAASPGIAIFSGSFEARLLKHSSLAKQAEFLNTTAAFYRTEATFFPSSMEKYSGYIMLSNITPSAAGAAVVKYSAAFSGCDGFKYSTCT